MPEFPGQSVSESNLARRIKRHVAGRQLTLFATTAPGLEAVTREELVGLSPTVQVTHITRGGIAFKARLIDLYRANLHLFSAGRILLRLTEFKATNFLQLRKRLLNLPWQLYLPPGQVPVRKISSHRSRLYHSRAIDEAIGDAIAAYWRTLDHPLRTTERQTLYVRLDQDRMSLSLDSSGANLYRRGLKTHSARAPLRETTAAGILKLVRYHADRPLCDPMCGAGTFSLEAALMAKRLPPGARRAFAFLEWPAFQARRWQHLLTEAAGSRTRLEKPLIWASDIDDYAVAALRACVARNDLEDAVAAERRDFFQDPPGCADSGGPRGLVVLNPPYGRRLHPVISMKDFYSRIAIRLHAAYAGWQAAVIVPERGLAELFPFCAGVHPFEHGGLQLYLLEGSIA